LSQALPIEAYENVRAAVRAWHILNDKRERPANTGKITMGPDKTSKTSLNQSQTLPPVGILQPLETSKAKYNH
jgi:hypothetical protein